MEISYEDSYNKRRHTTVCTRMGIGRPLSILYSQVTWSIKTLQNITFRDITKQINRIVIC